MCYVYSQWYDISCATLYTCVCIGTFKLLNHMFRQVASNLM